MKRMMLWFLPGLAAVALAGCRLPGKPRAGNVPLRPDQVTDFHVLYAGNCAACHGASGEGGAAVALRSPAYLAYAGAAPIRAITANGIPGSLMPAFVKEAGGLLTAQQIEILTQGIMAWGSPGELAAMHPPPYESHATGDAGRGAALYGTDCLRCHAPGRGSILDPVYLSLITDGGLRTLTVTGIPGSTMPDWRGYPGGPLTDQQVADLVSFMASHRAPPPQAALHGMAAAPTTPSPDSSPNRKAATP